MQPPDYEEGSEYHKRRRILAASTQKCVELAIAAFGMPASVLDMGCGEGFHLHWLEQHGAKTVGVDLVIPKNFENLMLHHADLRVPIDFGIVFDWVLCWEVAEHLPAESADILCDSLSRHVAKPKGRLLFTAARPGQRGPGHINCQPPEYWMQRLYERGLTYQPVETRVLAAQWAEQVVKAPWYGRNLTVYAWT